MEKLKRDLKEILNREAFLDNEISIIQEDLQKAIENGNDNDKLSYEQYLSELKEEKNQINEKKSDIIGKKKKEFVEREKAIKADIKIAKEDLKKARDEDNGNNILSYSEWLEGLEEDLSRIQQEIKNLDELNIEKIKEEIKKEKLENKKTKEDYKKSKWHPELTQDQIDELIAEGIEPGDPEYTLALHNYGIKPEKSKVKDKKEKAEDVNRDRQELEYLRSLLDDPDLDPSDMPDYNRQAILNRIAELEEKLKGKDKDGKDPTGKDPTGKDPAGKDPTGKDPTGKDPTGKDPAEKDPTGKDPTGKDPAGKDPTGKDPAEKYPNNLPIRSFWEIYNDTCTQHVGSIAHNINKVSHMKVLPAKEEDTLHKILNLPLAVLKLPMKLVAKIPNALMGTDRKMAEMQENIDSLSVQDFQVLVQSPEKVNQLFNAHVKDTFDRDYLDPQFMKQYKVNNAYLDVVRSRLGRERGTAISYYTEQANNAYERMQELEEVGRDNWTPEQQNEYNQAVGIYQNSVDEGKKFQKELDTFDEGAKKKSSSYRNISGWFLGKFNPDNREENAQMAGLSKARREMAQQGNRNEVNAITGQMHNLARDNTNLRGGGKNYIDRGAYSIESPVETLDRGPQTKGRLLLTNIAVISSALGLYNQVKDNIFNRQTVEAHNQHLQQVNNANKNIQVSGQAKVSDSPTAPQAEEAITRQTVEAGWNRAERGDLDATNWNFGSQYHIRDAQSHADGAQVATSADSLLQKGDNLGALKQATDYYSKVQGANRSDITSYMSSHPQHDYTAFSFGDSADMSKVYDFFANGVVPYQTNVNGTLAELMPALREGVDLNGVIFTGANALYQAQKEGTKDLRRQVRFRQRGNTENEPNRQPTHQPQQPNNDEHNNGEHNNDDERE